MNLSTMDELVHEYCLYRGLVEGGPHISTNGSGTSCDAVAAHLSDVLATGVENGFKAVGHTGPTLSSAQGGSSQIGEYMPDSVIVTPDSDHVLTDVVIGLELNIGCSQMEGLESAASDVVMEDPVVEVPEGMNTTYVVFCSLEILSCVGFQMVLQGLSSICQASTFIVSFPDTCPYNC